MHGDDGLSLGNHIAHRDADDEAGGIRAWRTRQLGDARQVPQVKSRHAAGACRDHFVREPSLAPSRRHAASDRPASSGARMPLVTTLSVAITDVPLCDTSTRVSASQPSERHTGLSCDMYSTCS